MKINCWDYKKCGRNPGGDKVEELGVCPAATEGRLNGANQGQNGGRICWLVTNTLCKSEIQGDFIGKLGNCVKCDFFKRVFREEGGGFDYGMRLLKILESD